MTTNPDTTATERGSGEAWTIDRVLRWVADDFRTKGIETPRLEAEILLAHALGCTRIQLIVDRDRPLMPAELTEYRAMVGRRRRMEPVAYLRGEREFYGHAFRVDARVLIPRPDTETLVETALLRTRDRSMFGRMLDLCTGSGNVAIAFAKERTTWRVDATDISAEALAVARDNAVRVGAVWSIRFLQGDLFEALAGEGSYDLITANPPYIPAREIEALAADIRDHEPRLALDGGPDGLEVIRRLVRGAPAYLVDGGVLAMEIGADQATAGTDLLVAAGFEDVRVDQDLGRRDRVVSGKRRARRADALQGARDG
jgi:release factor glutamine methyltransferase